jgi:4-aminobutyrate aminotransferase
MSVDSATANTYTPDEMMTIAAARLLWPGCVCFVGIGVPSAAANLARLTHAPDMVLIYESGGIGTRPAVLPLSIGDGELAETATAVVSLPEIFSYWLQAGRIDVGFLGAAQIDRFGNLNTTVIGGYGKPKTRLPGAGGAPEIAQHAKQIFVVLKQSPRTFVANLDFCTSTGFLSGHGERARRGIPGAGPQAVITDLGVLKPASGSEELTLTARYEDVSLDRIRAATGWPLAVADSVAIVPAPTAEELSVLRDLHKRTEIAHAGDMLGSKKRRHARSAEPDQHMNDDWGRLRHIRTELPGPKARALLARDAEVVSPSYLREYPFVMSHGRGAEVWDVDGNRFLDFAAGIAVCSTGHSHPQVVNAIKNAADEFLHISPDFVHERQVALGEKINALSPMGEPVLSFFCQSGTEAVEGALKLARYVSGRSRFIGFLGAFHGRTMGALAFTASKCTQQQGFFTAMPGVTHVPYPNPYRPLFAGDDQGQAVLDYIENVLFVSNVPPSEVAAVLLEPIQCEGGYVVPPDGFLAGLRQLCDRHGILLIFDEVQTGVGRSGKMFACQHWNVQPDIMTLAKGLGSGLPIGLVIAKKMIMQQWKRGAHANTYGGNPLCCAAALVTLDLVEREYAANAEKVGAYFMTRLRELQSRHSVIGDVRGKGLMIGMELVSDRASRNPCKDSCAAVITRAFHQGLLLLPCGQSTVRFVPPLIVSEAQVDEAITLLEAALVEALAQ